MIDLSNLGQNMQPGGLIGVILRALGLLKGGKSGGSPFGAQPGFSDLQVSRGRVSSVVDRKIGNPPAYGAGPGSQVREVRGMPKAPT